MRAPGTRRQQAPNRRRYSSDIVPPTQQSKLKVRLEAPPPNGGLWTSGKVAHWMAGELGLAQLAAQRGWEDKPVEVWATDEHRLGLKPIHRRVWAPIGERPIALGHHRYEWLYVTGFVAPARGETVWYLSNGIDKPFFAKLLDAFARETGAGRDRIIVLQLDNAGWHGPENLPVPDGIRLVYQPPRSPELQPAEHLWPLVDEPLVNRHFATIDDLELLLPSDAASSIRIQTSSKATPIFIGGQNPSIRANHPEIVSLAPELSTGGNHRDRNVLCKSVLSSVGFNRIHRQQVPGDHGTAATITEREQL
jgi:hypothetical protein